MGVVTTGQLAAVVEVMVVVVSVGEQPMTGKHVVEVQEVIAVTVPAGALVRTVQYSAHSVAVFCTEHSGFVQSPFGQPKSPQPPYWQLGPPHRYREQSP